MLYFIDILLIKGFVQGFGGLIHEIKDGITDALFDPIKGSFIALKVIVIITIILSLQNMI